jgi:tRNA-dihydrouridine synthase
MVNSTQSVKNGKKIFSFLKTLGTGGIDDVEQARKNLHQSIHDPAKQDMIAREIEGQREHFDNVSRTLHKVFRPSLSNSQQISTHRHYIAGDPHWLRVR